VLLCNTTLARCQLIERSRTSRLGALRSISLALRIHVHNSMQRQELQLTQTSTLQLPSTDAPKTLATDSCQALPGRQWFQSSQTLLHMAQHVDKMASSITCPYHLDLWTVGADCMHSMRQTSVHKQIGHPPLATVRTSRSKRKYPHSPRQVWHHATSWCGGTATTKHTHTLRLCVFISSTTNNLQVEVIKTQTEFSQIMS
jgi:hypothetical protein